MVKEGETSDSSEEANCVCGNNERFSNWIACSAKNCTTQWWHSQCAGFKRLSSNDAKKFEWSCPNCVLKRLQEYNTGGTELYSSKDTTPASALAKSVAKELGSQLQEMVQEAIKNCSTPKTYAAVTMANQPVAAPSNIEMKLFKKVAINNHASALAKDKKERNDRSCIVRQPGSRELNNSKTIRREFSKLFPGKLIRNCRTTAGGSILIELDDNKSAQEVLKNWNEEYFGGNKGIYYAGMQNVYGIIKFVDDILTQEDIQHEVSAQYTGVSTDLFRRGPDKTFTGIVKLRFSSKEQLELAIKNKIKIGQQLHYVEEFVQKPKVITCNRCQKFDHISRLCRSSHLKCGRCSSTKHETKDTDKCTVKAKEDFECCHCSGNHLTGSRFCPILQQKKEELFNRLKYGF